jgi:hypothetical protein
MSLTLCISLMLVLSVSGNIFLGWYLSRLLKRFVFLSENLSDLLTLVSNYGTHLKQLYNMEAFYGEPTLEHLIAHTKDLLEILKDYEDVYSIALPLEEIEGEEDFDETSEEAPEAQDQPKDVFYAGTRRRNS